MIAAEQVPAAIVVVASTLWILATSRLRIAALGLLVQFAAANALSASVVPRNELVLLGAAALASALTLYVAARDGTYGEDPGWRVWPAVAISGVGTAVAFAVFRSAQVDAYFQLAAFWLLASGLGILFTARTAARLAVGALVMLSGTQLVLHFGGGSQLGLTIVFAWTELLLTLVGAFLVVNQRALEHEP